VKPLSLRLFAVLVLLACGAATAQGPTYKIFGGTNFEGNDLSQVPASTTRECAAICVAVAQCNAFTFNIPRNTCYLKSAPSRFDPTLFAESGVVEGRGTGMPPTGSSPASPPALIVVPQGRPTSCSAAGNDVCSGCSISCPAGQQASCAEGEVHRTEGFSPVCWTRAKCECR
jgi:hypothetical protein